MSYPHKIVTLKVSAIVHSTEDSGKVTHAISNVSQLNGSAEPAISRAKGHHGNQITTLVLTIKNPNAADNCLLHIWNRLTALDKNTVFSSLTSRVDNAGTLFLRIDKQEAFKGIIRLQDSDPIKVEIFFKTSQSKQDGVVGDIWKFMTQLSSDITRSRQTHTLLFRSSGRVTGE